MQFSSSSANPPAQSSHIHTKRESPAMFVCVCVFFPSCFVMQMAKQFVVLYAYKVANYYLPKKKKKKRAFIFVAVHVSACVLSHFVSTNFDICMRSDTEFAGAWIVSFYCFYCLLMQMRLFQFCCRWLRVCFVSSKVSDFEVCTVFNSKQTGIRSREYLQHKIFGRFFLCFDLQIIRMKDKDTGIKEGQQAGERQFTKNPCRP